MSRSAQFRKIQRRIPGQPLLDSRGSDSRLFRKLKHVGIRIECSGQSRDCQGAVAEYVTVIAKPNTQFPPHHAPAPQSIPYRPPVTII